MSFGEGTGSRRLLTRSPAARQMTLAHLIRVIQARKSVREGEMAPRAPVAWSVEKGVLGSPGALKTSPPAAAFGRDLSHTVNEGAPTKRGTRTMPQGGGRVRDRCRQRQFLRGRLAAVWCPPPQILLHQCIVDTLNELISGRDSPVGAAGRSVGGGPDVVLKSWSGTKHHVAGSGCT